MKTAETKTKTEQAKRKPRLSPELAEFLHMLNALEVELDSKTVTAH